MYDVPHLIKSVRNTLLLTNDIKTQDGVASWAVSFEIYNLEKSSVTKACHKLTQKHIYQTNLNECW